MAEYDGEIRIKAVVDSTSIEKDLAKQKNAYKELSKEREQLLKSQSKYEKQSSKLIRQQDTLNERLKTQENRYQKIKDKLDLFKSSTDFSAMNIYSKEEETRIKHFEMDLGLIADKIKKLNGEIENTNKASIETTKELKNISYALKLNYSNIDKSKKLIKSFEIASKLKKLKNIIDNIKAELLAEKLKKLKNIIDNIKTEKLAELERLEKLKNLKNMVDSIKTEKLEEKFKGLENIVDTGKSQKDLSDLGKGIKNLENTVKNIKSENLKEVSRALENVKTKYSEENVNRLQKALENVKPDNLEEIKKALDGLKIKNLEEIKKALDGVKTTNSEENIKKLQKAIESVKPDNLEEIKKALEDIKTTNSEENIKKLQEAINNIKPNNLEENINRLQESINNVKTTEFDGRIKNLKDGLKGLDIRLRYGSYSLDALKSGFEKIKGSTGGLDNSLKNNLNNTIKNITGSFSGFGSRISDGIKNAGKSVGGFSNRILNLAKAAFVFNILRSGFRELSEGLMSLIKSDDSLSRSLQEIKANLLTAFAPIYEAVLPALRELGKFLSWASLQLATFISALFGKTLSQSQKSAQQISRVVDSSTKKQKKGLKSVSKEAKETADTLASFDKIEVLNIDKGSQKPEKVPADVDVESVGINEDAFKPVESSVSSFWNEIAERFKAPFKDIDLSNITNAFDDLKNTLSDFDIGEGLWWFYEHVLAPFATWTISDAIPSFLRVFNSVLKLIQPIAKQVGKDLAFIYDKFLAPVAKWVGSLVTGFLNGLADVLENIADFLSDENNKVLLEWIVSFLEALALEATVVGIKKLCSVLTTKMIPAIWGIVKSAWALTVSLFSNPWTWVVIGIGLVIAGIIMLIRHWDDVKKFFSDVWDGFIKLIDDIKDKAIEFGKKVGDWIKSIGESISNKWNEIWDGAANGIKEFGNKCIRFLNSITGGIRKFSNGIVDGINSLIDKLNGFGFKMPDWLGGWEFKMHVPKIPRVPESFLHIPELAQGAVLDGSSPFLAWLNDQPKGQTNIETPLNTMVEAFNKAIDNRGMNNNVVIQASGDISQLISYLHFELRKENSRIGDNMISGSVYV